MCTENQNDIPIRSVVVEQNGKWLAYCVDFGLEAESEQLNDAVDQLETAITKHMSAVRAGEKDLFPTPDPRALQLYLEAAKSKLLASGPGHGHVEHRALLLSRSTAATG